MAKRYVIAVDIGGTAVKSALVTLKGNILYKDKLPTAGFRGRKKLIDAVASAISNIILTKGLKRRDILGIGVGGPGPIDGIKGIVHYFVNIPGWKEVPLKRIIERRFKIAAYIDNDVNVMTLGELSFGSGRGIGNFVCITIGTSVGGGIVIGGRLYRGNTLSAGEIGHTTIADKGPVCSCGNRGCLQCYVGNKYIVDRVKKEIRGGRRTSITRLAGGRLNRITPVVIDMAAKGGDRFAIGIWKETGHYIGTALANTVNILNPEMIVIGGGIAEAGRVLFDSIRKTVRERAMDGPAEAVRIVKAKLGYDAGLIGAVPLVMTKGK